MGTELAREPRDFGELAKEYAAQGRYPDAERTLREGLEYFTGHPILSYALGIILLRGGPSIEAWQCYEFRWSVPFGPRHPKLSIPKWSGEPVQSLVVLPEQGLGDQIMFSRYFAALLENGIAPTVVCPPSLLRTFQSIGVETIAAEGSISVPKRDAWCFIGSLPLLVGRLPTQPHIRGSSTGEGLGLMLEGGPRFPERSLSPAAAETIAHLGKNLHPSATGARDFEDTAEIIRGLEGVISVDTSVAHLAASMGKPTWILLPHDADWRWGGRQRESIWYPSAHLIRQSDPGDWGAPIRELNRSLGAQ